MLLLLFGSLNNPLGPHSINSKWVWTVVLGISQVVIGLVQFSRRIPFWEVGA